MNKISLIKFTFDMKTNDTWYRSLSPSINLMILRTEFEDRSCSRVSEIFARIIYRVSKMCVSIDEFESYRG